MRYKDTYVIIITTFFAIILSPHFVFSEDDQELKDKAINYVIDEQLDKAVKTARTISDPNIKLETMTEIGQIDASQFWSVWGVALMANIDIGDSIPVESASIINGIVRVEEEDKVKVGLGLEVHRFIWGVTWGATKRTPWDGAIALGPYVAVLPTTNEIIDAVGGGIIVGFFGGRSSEAVKRNFSMNLGCGFYVDPNTQILADDFEDGEPPPEGETTVRFKEVSQYGIQTMLSITYKF